MCTLSITAEDHVTPLVCVHLLWIRGLQTLASLSEMQSLPLGWYYKLSVPTREKKHKTLISNHKPHHDDLAFPCFWQHHGHIYILQGFSFGSDPHWGITASVTFTKHGGWKRKGHMRRRKMEEEEGKQKVILQIIHLHLIIRVFQWGFQAALF